MKEKVYYRLPMVCSCGDRDNSHLIDEACAIFNKDSTGPQVTRDNLLSNATYFFSDLQCHIQLVADQWAGVDIICTEWNDDEDDDASEWIETYKFRVECDLVEEGLARAIIHTHEMHMVFNPNGWYAKWYNKN